MPEPLPKLLRDVRRVRLDQRDDRFGREAGRGIVCRGSQRVDQLHHGGDRRVEDEAATDVVAHLRDRLVRLAGQRAFRRTLTGRLLGDLVDKPPQPP